MALADPLPTAAFADLLKVEDVSFVQAFQQQRSATGGGETRYGDRGPALWKAEITSGPVPNAEAEGIMALINSRAGGLKTVLLHNYRLPCPPDDPDGLLIEGASPALLSISDRLHTSLTGFPAGYKIAIGTYFGIVFDTSRHYLGQFVEARTASSIGNVGQTEIWPPLPASVPAGAALTLVRPPAKFRIVPGSAYPATAGSLHTTIKFSAEQTYR